MSDLSSVAVVGGGIAGASVAEHLSVESDATVTVFERNDCLAAETTDASGGFLSFGVDDDPIDVRLIRYAITRYNEFLTDSDLPYRYVGRLHVATTAERARELRSAVTPDQHAHGQGEGEFSATTATATHGTPVQYLDGEELGYRLLLPTLDDEAIAGALLRPAFGHVSPGGMARAFVDRARAGGVRFRTNAPVDRIVTREGRAVGVEVDGDLVEADAVVAAAGPWNPTLLETAGVEVPIRHSVAPVLVLEPESGIDRWTPSIKHEESGYYFRQNADGTLFVGHNPGGYAGVGRDLDPDDVAVPSGMHAEVRDVFKEIAPGLGETTLVSEDVGVRCLTPDGRPIVGETGVEGLSVVAFSASGIHHAPVAGWIIARQLVHDDPTEFSDAVAPDRFDREKVR